jgi:hypothetical protein
VASRTWRFSYVRSAALAERGVSLNTVRAALEAIGEIVEATPAVASDADEATFARLALAWLDGERGQAAIDRPIAVGVVVDDDDEPAGLVVPHGVELAAPGGREHGSARAARDVHAAVTAVEARVAPSGPRRSPKPDSVRGLPGRAFPASATLAGHE